MSTPVETGDGSAPFGGDNGNSPAEPRLGDASQPTPLQDDDPARTPRIESHSDHGIKTEESSQTPGEPDYFGNITENRKSSSGFLASLTSSNLSSPLQSAYASSASLQSSSEHASGELNTPHIDDAAAGLDQAVSARLAHAERQHAAAGSVSSETSRRSDQSHSTSHSLTSVFPYSYLQARNSDYSSRAGVYSSHSSDKLSAASVSISADHTPIQSPGLFQPKRHAGDSPVPRAEKGPSLLHPTHHARVTKETNKLIKDFDSVTGNKTMNDYEVFEKLGVGSHGAVKRARHLISGEDVAIKIVRRYGKKGRLGKHESPEDKVRKEIAVLKKARHSHVVSLLEVIDDPGAQKVYLVLEYVRRGEIIWRTETSREIARFEMNRIKRELEGNIDAGFEWDLEAEFNVKVERARVLARLAKEERQARKAEVAQVLNQNSAANNEPLRRYSTIEHDNSYADFETGLSSSNDYRHWSNEVGGNESDSERAHRFQPSFTGRRGLSTSFSFLPGDLHHEGSSAIEHPREQLALLVGSQYGPYSVEEKPTASSEFALARYLGPLAPTEEEWTPAENAFRFVPCMTMTQVRDAFRDTVLGLEYLHYQGIIHRDIKPANLLWTEDYRVKISDFGVSYIGKPIRDREYDDFEEPPTDLDEEYELAKTVGTPAFYAPELCDPDWFDASKSRARPKVTGQIDVWALGVSLYAMVYGRLPFFDENDEFAMYEKIARQEAFLSSKRLRGVDENGRLTNCNKRSPELVEHEDVDGLLKDLLKRLLAKDPAHRATLKEVKRHPWVLQGLPDQDAWINETDPSRHSEGKIEVSNKDVDFALAPLNLVDRIKHGFRRIGSVVRGRDARRRAESDAKETTGSNSSRSANADRDGRRPSLRGDEQIVSALRASRESADHPLAYSVTASPVTEKAEPMFVRPISQIQVPTVSLYGHRPSFTERSESTTESIRTIKPASFATSILPLTPSAPEDIKAAAHNESNASSSSGLSGLFGIASRRLTSHIRKDRGQDCRDNSSASSRTSSVENMSAGLEDSHAPPSIALSPAIAAGQVDHSHLSELAPIPQPPANRTRAEQEQQYHAAAAAHIASRWPISPDDDACLADRSHSSADQLDSIGTRSSDDQLALSESYSNRSIPSTSTSTSQPDNASSMLATAETIRIHKSVSPPLAAQTTQSTSRTPPRQRDSLRQHDDDEAGYHGDGDGNGEGNSSDEDDDDDGLVMMGTSRR